MTEDRATLGVTSEGQECLEALLELGWFKREMDAYRFSIAIALANELQPDTTLGRVETKWNIGTIDRDGKLAEVIESLVLDGAAPPYVLAERYAAVGLRFLRQRLVDDHASLEDLIRLEVPSS